MTFLENKKLKRMMNKIANKSMNERTKVVEHVSKKKKSSLERGSCGVDDQREIGSANGILWFRWMQCTTTTSSTATSSRRTCCSATTAGCASPTLASATSSTAPRTFGSSSTSFSRLDRFVSLTSVIQMTIRLG